MNTITKENKEKTAYTTKLEILQNMIDFYFESEGANFIDTSVSYDLDCVLMEIGLQGEKLHIITDSMENDEYYINLKDIQYIIVEYPTHDLTIYHLKLEDKKTIMLFIVKY